MEAPLLCAGRLKGTCAPPANSCCVGWRRGLIARLRLPRCAQGVLSYHVSSDKLDELKGHVSVSSPSSTLLFDGQLQMGVMVALANMDSLSLLSKPQHHQQQQPGQQQSPQPSSARERPSIIERHEQHKQRRQGLLDALTTRSLFKKVKQRQRQNTAMAAEGAASAAAAAASAALYFTIVTPERQLCLRTTSELERASWLRYGRVAVRESPCSFVPTHRSRRP